jgi:hypothetical protein
MAREGLDGGRWPERTGLALLVLVDLLIAAETRLADASGGSASTPSGGRAAGSCR